MRNKWIFIIDTDSYAGNFERDMCAYVTGVLGECEVGDEFAAIYNKEVNTDGLESVFVEYLEHRADEHGCHRPCSLWETKGWLSVGFDKAVKEADWDQAKADAAFQKENAKIYQGYYDQTAKLDLDDPQVKRAGWTKASKERELKEQQKNIDKALKEKARKYSPNNSVAIFFEKKPTEEMVALMKERAGKFVEAKRQVAKQKGYSWDEKFKLTIHGFRLVKESTSEIEEEI